MKERILKAETQIEGGLKLFKLVWGKDPIFQVYNKRQHDAKDYSRVLVRGEDLKSDLSAEPCVFNTMTRLSCVGSHRVLKLGEGSRSKSGSKNNYKQDEDVDEDSSSNECLREVPPDLDLPQRSALPIQDNIWWSSGNALKQCVYGCIANLLHHMGEPESAQEFKRMVTLDNASLLHELKLTSFPRNVISHIPGQVDKIQLSLWLLREHFKVHHTQPMNEKQFRTMQNLVDNLMEFKFPVLLSMNITNAFYKHVIVVWQGMVIDFEQWETYPLTASNIDFSCGSCSTFLNLDRGYGLFPTKKMKKHIKEKYGILDVGLSGYATRHRKFFKIRQQKK